MSTVEQQAIVQAKLSSGENVVAVHEASLLQGWVRASRLLALVQQDSNHALFVFLSSRTPPQLISDLSIERVLPVDVHFSCQIDPESKHQDCADVYVNVSSLKVKLLFEMIPGVKTSTFVGEIFRTMDVFSKRRGPPADFSWLAKYIGGGGTGGGHQFSTSPTSAAAPATPGGGGGGGTPPPLDSPDIAVPRQNIAQGKAPIAARESVIRHQMVLHSSHYTYTKMLRVFIGTWNVNGQPPSTPLSDWLAADPEPPDIYAVGFQELDLSKEAFLFNDTPREAEWQEFVITSLHPGGKYRKVELVRLVGMMLLVFVQEKHFAYVRNVSVETVGTGIMGKMGNKGGVGLRMELHSTSMCFVNSHLAAHVEEYERRNQDYHEICSRMCFSRSHPTRSIKDHDQVYWLGDLNYRITELDPRTVKDYVDQGNYAPVLQYDQLNQQHGKRNVFAMYREGALTFRPTYKYDPGSDDWDSSEKNRAPAWCDRVLWCGEDIKQVAYRSHPQLKLSDHKPVSALFDSQVRKIDAAKYRKVHEEVMKKLDKLENEFLPQVMVDNTEIILDTVRYLEPQSKDLIIANTGQVPVTFEFIKKLDDSSFCKEWLSIEPYAGFIMPGEKCDVKLEVLVDKRSAFKLNSGEDKLYDILVLHLEGGKDIFITVTGSYERSCFGCSIEALVHVRVPVREMPAGRIAELEGGGGGGGGGRRGPEAYPVPKEVWYLVDHLYRHGLKQHQLFLQPGLNTELGMIRAWLDGGSLEPLPGGVHSVAESLLLLLESSAEPIVPYNLHNICLGASTSYLQCKQIVMQLPEHRKNVFLYLCAFLQELLSHAADNALDAKTIATLFGSVFLRDPPRNRGEPRARNTQQTHDRKKMNFVYHFLVNDQSDLMRV